jgi:hypothetical protein
MFTTRILRSGHFTLLGEKVSGKKDFGRNIYTKETT